MSLGPVWTGSGSGLSEGVQALPPTVASLALPPELSAEREGDGAGGAWRVHMLGSSTMMGVPVALELCAAFDRPGLPSCLEGQVGLTFRPPAEAGLGPLGTYLGQCAEVAGRLSGGDDDDSFLFLAMKVLDAADEVVWAGEAAGGGGGGGGAAGVGGAAEGAGFLGRVLGTVLPAAALHVCRLELWVQPSAFRPGFIRHLLAVPGLAFPLLEGAGVVSGGARADRSDPGRARRLHGSVGRFRSLAPRPDPSPHRPKLAGCSFADEGAVGGAAAAANPGMRHPLGVAAVAAGLCDAAQLRNFVIVARRAHGSQGSAAGDKLAKGATEAAARDEVLRAVIALGPGPKGLQAGDLQRRNSATPGERLEAMKALGPGVAAAVDAALAQWPVAAVVGWWGKVVEQTRQHHKQAEAAAKEAAAGTAEEAAAGTAASSEAGSQPRRSKRSKAV